jgi:hypothetical protein
MTVITLSDTHETYDELEALRDILQEIGLDYLGARRRSGAALLEAAGHLARARGEAASGEWLPFLRATATSPDTAERLLHIHRRADEMPQFAAWVAQHNEPSLAYELARPSTPPEVVQAVVEAEEPPTLQQVKAMKKAAAEQGADVAAPSEEPQPAPPPAPPLRERLERVVGELRAVLSQDGPLGEEERQLVREIQALIMRLAAKEE